LKPKKLDTGYFPLNNQPLELRKLLESALMHESKTLLSLIEPGSVAGDDSHTFNTQIVGYSSSENFAQFLITPELRKAQEHSEAKEAMAVIFLKGSNLLCMQTLNLEWQKKVIQLSAPWRIIKFQRRKEIRLVIPRAYEYYAEVPMSKSLTHKFRIIDISAQGMSIQAVAPREAALLPKSCIIPRLTLTIDGVKIVTGGRVASHSPVEGRRGVRIGLEFKRMSVDNSHVVSAFVSRYLAQYHQD